MSNLINFPSPETDRLRRCVNDLVALIALPAVWSGGDLLYVGETLLDVLKSMLNADLLYLRLFSNCGGAPLEFARVAFGETAVKAAAVGAALDSALGQFPGWPPISMATFTGADLVIAHAQLGLQGAAGVLVAGSRDVAFPTEEERLILSIAANQAAIAAHDAARLSEQRNLAAILDGRVAQRSAELAEANVALRREMEERQRTEAERRLAEEARDKFRADLSHISRLTSLGTMAAAIAHEVNQPLSGIITNANTSLRMLSATPPNMEGALEAARRTIRDGNRATEVVARVRALFKKQATATEPVDLNDATREVIGLIGNDLQRNRITIKTQFEDELPLIEGDRVQLQQVVMNLLRNAADALGEVSSQPREIVVRTEFDGEAILMSVADTGAGVDEKDIDRMFDALHTSKPDGMGIGLSVSRSIIESHNGQIWASANKGHGAIFAFSIPLSSTIGGDAESLNERMDFKVRP